MKRCIRRQDGKVFAVKMSEVEEEHLLYLRKIFNITLSLCLLNHPSILGYYSMYINMKERTCRLVMQYISYPNLSEYIYGKMRPLSEA